MDRDQEGRRGEYSTFILIDGYFALELGTSCQ